MENQKDTTTYRSRRYTQSWIGLRICEQQPNLDRSKFGERRRKTQQGILGLYVGYCRVDLGYIGRMERMEAILSISIHPMQRSLD